MIFNEIYGCYYNAVAKMLRLAVDGRLTEKEMHRIVSEEAFDESMLSIIPAIKGQEWQLIDRTLNTPLISSPVMPLTILEKRWLKTIMMDPRVALFAPECEGLDDVEPLFRLEDVVYFDQYLDGDEYTNQEYIARFHQILQAIREQRKIKVEFWSSKNKKRTLLCAPIQIEYSDKEDKFRIIAIGSRGVVTINMGRIVACELTDEIFEKADSLILRERKVLEFELSDTRNALERAMMKFAHYKKRAERVDDTTYRVEIEYDAEDETDLLIQIMSFGSAVNVLGPQSILEEIKNRLKKQLLSLDW